MVLHTVEILPPGGPHDWRLVLELPVRSRISEDQVKVRAVGALREAHIEVPDYTHLRYVGLVTIGPTAK